MFAIAFSLELENWAIAIIKADDCERCLPNMTIFAVNFAQLGEYMAHARQIEHHYDQQMRQRQEAGLIQAEIAADLLKQQFGIKEVFLFGSLLFPKLVHPESDIDLAVWGLDSDRYCEAAGTLLCTVKGFNVDLIRLETAQRSLFDCIVAQGVRL